MVATNDFREDFKKKMMHSSKSNAFPYCFGEMGGTHPASLAFGLHHSTNALQQLDLAIW